MTKEGMRERKLNQTLRKFFKGKTYSYNSQDEVSKYIQEGQVYIFTY